MPFFGFIRFFTVLSTRQIGTATVNYRQGEISVNDFYLLPCPCSHKIPVQPRQAGEIITCACGASLEVPTLLKLKTLERAAIQVEQKTPKTAWNAGHRLIFLGAVAVVGSLGIGTWLFLIRPTDPYANFPPEKVKEAVQLLPPVDTWRLWHAWEQSGLQRHNRGLDIALAGQKTQYQIYWVLLALVVGTGLTLVTAGIIIVEIKKNRTRNIKNLS